VTSAGSGWLEDCGEDADDVEHSDDVDGILITAVHVAAVNSDSIATDTDDIHQRCDD